ncbi:hypothetical protein ACN3XK_54825 [Actinomadura welshii]
MDTEVVVWTAIFLGGDLLAVVLLLFWAVRKDREKRAGAEDAAQG